MLNYHQNIASTSKLALPCVETSIYSNTAPQAECATMASQPLCHPWALSSGSGTMADSPYSATSTLPIISPMSSAGSLSPNSAASSLWFEESTASSTAVAQIPQPPNLDGSLLGLYESIVACQHATGWNATSSNVAFPPQQPEEEQYREPNLSDFGLRRRARSSFSSHRRAIQKSKSTSFYKSARERRDTGPPSPIVIPHTEFQPEGPLSLPFTPELSRPSMLKHRASFLDIDPSSTGLKSPTKVLAYQARVRQQRSAMRAIIDDLKTCLRKATESTTTLSTDCNALFGTIKSLLVNITEADPTPVSGRSRASSRASEHSHISRKESSIGLPAIDLHQQPDIAAGLQAYQSFTASPLDSYFSRTGERRAGSPLSNCFAFGQDTLGEAWSGDSRSESTDDKLRSRQKNAYKQRLRSQELSGMEFLSGLAKAVLQHVHSTAAAQRSSGEQQMLRDIKAVVWRHRGEWDLLLAAERRLGWGKPQRSKVGGTSGSDAPMMPAIADADSMDSQGFGLLVPFFFLSYPNAPA